MMVKLDIPIALVSPFSCTASIPCERGEGDVRERGVEDCERGEGVGEM